MANEPEILIDHEIASLKRTMLARIANHEGDSVLSPWTVLRLIVTLESKRAAAPVPPAGERKATIESIRERWAKPMRLDISARRDVHSLLTAYDEQAEEIEQLRYRDRLWNTAFDTSQLTHAKARLEVAEAKAQRVDEQAKRIDEMKAAALDIEAWDKFREQVIKLYGLED